MNIFPHLKKKYPPNQILIDILVGFFSVTPKIAIAVLKIVLICQIENYCTSFNFNLVVLRLAELHCLLPLPMYLSVVVLVCCLVGLSANNSASLHSALHSSCTVH